MKISLWILGSFIVFIFLISLLIFIYKDDIKKYALQTANQYLNKEVHVSNIDVGIWRTFPNVALSFDNVMVYSKFGELETTDTAFYAKRLDLRFSLLDFYRKNYTIHEVDATKGKIYLKILKNGAINYDFLKESEDTVQVPFEFNLKRIHLKGIRFSYSNEALQEYHSGYFYNVTLKGAFNEKQFMMDAKTDFQIGKIQSKSLILIENQHAECKIAIQMDYDNNIFEIKSAKLKINDLPFSITGRVSDYNVNFYISAKQLDLIDVAKNFAFQELEVVDRLKGKGTVDFNLYIKGKGSKTEAIAIDADFAISNGSLSEKEFTLSNIQLTGEYSNGVSTDSEHLSLTSIQFHSLNKDFQGNLRITNFNHPRFVGKANGTLDLKAISSFFSFSGLQDLSGNIDVQGNFDINLALVNNVVKDVQFNDVKASLDLHQIAVQWADDSRQILIPEGQLTIRNQAAAITGLTLNINKSSAQFDGEFNQIAKYINKQGNLYIDADISSNYLNIEDLASNAGSTSEPIKTWLLPDNISGNVRLMLNTVEYSGHKYSSIQTKMSFGAHELTFPYLEGVNSGAKVVGNLTLTETSPMYLVVNANLKSDAVKFSPLFKEWNNFDQTVISADNIKGQASILLNMTAPFDLYEQKIVKDKFDVTTSIQITDGALINVETFKEITKSLKSSAARLMISKSNLKDFEERLLNLQFATFENSFSIKNGVIYIPKMVINSNAIDLTLEGTHTFDNAIDYSFEFRFRDLKSKKHSEFGDIEDDETGFRVYLKMTGTVENPIFSWDKDAKKLAKKEKEDQAKEDLKSVLKEGFGINKKDSTIQKIESEKFKEDKVILDFGTDPKQSDEFSPENKEKRKGKFQKKVEEWQKENKKEQETEFEFE
ncbi:MAG: hypothetical protein M9897_12020 [Brumimicrobium sp.]|nr:hypothetical protein [Brumimicrobium sp.]